MWASAREELRRPGLRGGGGGKPLLAGTGLGCTTGLMAAGGVAIGAAFLLMATCTGLATALRRDLSTDLAGGLGTTLTDALGTGLVAGLVAGFVEAWEESLEAVFTGI